MYFGISVGNIVDNSQVAPHLNPHPDDYQDQVLVDHVVDPTMVEPIVEVPAVGVPTQSSMPRNSLLG